MKPLVKEHGIMWSVYGKTITPIKITDIKHTGIKYPDTALYRYLLADKPGDIVLENGQTSIVIGRKYYTLHEDDAINRVKQKK